jgi:hypothetical protein
VEAIRSIGGTALYDYEVDADGDPIQPSPDPGWLAKLIGMDYMHNVVSVEFPFGSASDPEIYDYEEVVPFLDALPHVLYLTLSKGNLRDDDLRHVAGMKSLAQLRIFDNQITGIGFRHLSNLKHLTWIELGDCPISDDGMEAIAKYPQFEKLALLHTSITDDGIDQLKKVASLKILDLDGTSTINSSRITDGCIDTLSKIAGLNAIGLRYTQITADGIQRLSELKPALHIGCLPIQTPPNPGKNVTPE